MSVRAVDILLSLDAVDPSQLGVMGHSLGGHGSFFLAAYDQRLSCCVSNCAASFFRHNERSNTSPPPLRCFCV